MDAYFRYAQKKGNDLGYYPDRGEIERGYLKGRRLETGLCRQPGRGFLHPCPGRGTDQAR